MNKKISLALFLFACAALVSFKVVSAQVQPKIEYNGQPVIDTDLDGLTDQGEIQAYKTDPFNVDTDGDSFHDGVEILAGSNPVEQVSTPENISSQSGQTENVVAISEEQVETPWIWYISRASGVVAFFLLYVSIFLVLTIRIPFFKRFLSPLFAMNGHKWIALQATFFALLHGVILTFHDFLSFSLKSVFIPFTSTYEPLLVAFGTIGFYLMVLLVISSYGRKYLSYGVWRAIHFFNIGLYFIVVIHAFYLGTDLKVPLLRDIFIFANAFLVALMLTSMFMQIKNKIASRKQQDIDIVQ